MTSTPSFVVSTHCEELERKIVSLSIAIHAATYRLLCCIRELDSAAGWGTDGFRSCAHWLSWRVGVGLGVAREKVRVAHALADLPKVSAAFERGEVSYSKVRAMTRIATPANEGDLLHIAVAGSASHIEKLVRLMRRADMTAEAHAEHELNQHEARALQTYYDDDGMLVVRGRLTPEQGALTLRDGGCRFPGCTNSRFTDGHHIEHWSAGGETKIDNLVQLCRSHHRLVHEAGWRVEGKADADLRFVPPDSPHALPSVPELPPVVGDAVAALRGHWEDRGTDVISPGALPVWGGESMNYEFATEQLALLSE